VPAATVATFNIRHGRGSDGRVDLARTADVIRRSGAGLIALQELDRFHPRSDGVDQPAELARLTGLQMSFVPTIARDGWEYGIAVASDDGLGDLRTIDLPRFASAEPRRAIAGRWRGLDVIATHLGLGREENARQQQALADLVARASPGLVLLGDFNQPRWRLRAWRARGLIAAPFLGASVDPWWRLRQIDHVFTRPPVSAGRARRVPGDEASDHRCVAVSLRWPVEDVVRVTYDA
jgi:endonuclease/exonuclease/phosphatase family metal-dependent hydrolase